MLYTDADLPPEVHGRIEQIEDQLDDLDRQEDQLLRELTRLVEDNRRD